MKNFSFRLRDLQSLSINPPFPKVSYRSLAYIATVLTGFASLCAQVAWQKYLTILVGSETRSISLVVAIFLLGLATGYYVFGKLTEKKWSRWQLLKIYGWVELITALYISSFYIYFDFLRDLSFNSPAHLLMDIAIAFLALFPPTFLMGASLPALTATLPEESKEINPLHIRIYGWNTLGAFLGVLVSGFYFLSTFGLALTLTIAGILNAIAALIFMGNKLEGDIHRQKAPPEYPSRIPNTFYMVSAFFAGAVVISFEVLFVRLLNVSVGAGVYNFPIILSLFVGGLALGSLSIRQKKISAEFFIHQIFITVMLLLVLFFLSPYWSVWIAHMRVSLHSIPSNYFVFKVALYLFLFFMLFPAVFFMGRLLPLTYALLKKNEENYGSFCGYLYFFNTIGTVVGTLVIGYLAFYFFNLDDLFQINIVFLLILILFAAFYEKKTSSVVLSFILGLSVCFLPNWNRTGHHLGYFRDRSPIPIYFKNLFSLPKKYRGDVLLFNDGPNASITLIGHKNKNISSKAKALVPSGDYSSVSFVVNGKAIGRTIGGDFSTMFLLSGLGYLYAPERGEEGLSSAVIGLGTGISAGLMGKLEKSREVTVLEIAPEVIESVRKSPSFNFGLNKNPKVKVLAQDGFKYFTKTRKKFDLILSEPSNPWIVGVENVFSYEFYELAKNSLTEDGVLVQWAQLYSIDFETLGIMFHTLKTVFPYAKLYRIGVSDIAIVASPKPLRFVKERFFDPVLMPYHEAMGFYEPEDMFLAQVFPENMFSKIALSNRFGLHTLVSPKLAYRGDKTFFLARSIHPEDMRPDYLFHPSDLEDQKVKAFKKYSSLSQDEIRKKCVSGLGFLCGILIQAVPHQKSFRDKKKPSALRFRSYSYLRGRGLVKHDTHFLEELKEEIVKENIKDRKLLFAYLSHISGRKQYKKARNDLALFHKKGLLSEKLKTDFEQIIQSIEKELSNISIN